MTVIPIYIYVDMVIKVSKKEVALKQCHFLYIVLICRKLFDCRSFDRCGICNRKGVCDFFHCLYD